MKDLTTLSAGKQKFVMGDMEGSRVIIHRPFFASEPEEVARVPTKYSKLECPKFVGNDFKGWLLKIKQFLKANRTRKNKKLRIMMKHLEGRALQLHQRFMKNHESLQEVSQLIYVTKMKTKFVEIEFFDPMLEIVMLKQNNTVDEFYEEFENLLNLLSISYDNALSIFLKNLKPEISKPVRMFYPKSLSHAYQLAKQMESLIYNVPRKPYIPYKNPVMAPHISHNNPYTSKFTLPSLLLS